MDELKKSKNLLPGLMIAVVGIVVGATVVPTAAVAAIVAGVAGALAGFLLPADGGRRSDVAGGGVADRYGGW